jgi:kynurenine formamidase
MSPSRLIATATSLAQVIPLERARSAPPGSPGRIETAVRRLLGWRRMPSSCCAKRVVEASPRREPRMRIVDLSMTVEECDSAPFAKDEYYFKLKPIVTWEEKGFVSNVVEMTVHAGTHIDTPHHFFRDMPGIEQLPLDAMIGEAIVMDLTFKGKANERITPKDLERSEQALAKEGITITPGATIFLRTDWPKGHVTTDPKWWDESPCLTKEAAEWLVAKQPKVLGYDFAQEEKGAGIGYEKAGEILQSAMPVHRTILPKIVYQIENLTNLDQIPSRAKVVALPAKWKTESAPARVIALLDD